MICAVQLLGAPGLNSTELLLFDVGKVTACLDRGIGWLARVKCGGRGVFVGLYGTF